MLVGKKKIKFKPSATCIAKDRETEPPSTHSTGATIQNQEGTEGEGRDDSTEKGCSTSRMQAGSQAPARADSGNLHSIVLVVGPLLAPEQESPAVTAIAYLDGPLQTPCSIPSTAAPQAPRKSTQAKKKLSLSRAALPCSAVVV